MHRLLSLVALVSTPAFAGYFAFTPPQYLDFQIPQGAARLAPGDLDGDGSIDYAVTDAHSLSNTIFFGGVFGHRESGAVVLSLPESAGVGLGDADGDTDLDLVYFSNVDTSRLVVVNNGDRTFEPPVRCESGATEGLCGVEVLPVSPPRNFTESDFDGDGGPDVPQESGDSIEVFLANGSTIVAATFPGRSALFANYTRVDLDANGTDDLIIGVGPGEEPGPFEIYSLSGQGDGTFEAPTLQFTVETEASLAFATLREMTANLDGSSDFELQGYFETPDFFGQEIRFLLLTVGNGLLNQIELDLSIDLQFSDVNEDTFPDMIQFDRFGSRFSVQRGVAAGDRFDAGVNIGFGRAETARVAAGDFNGDMLRDVALFGMGRGGQVRVFSQTSPGIFNDGETFLTEMSALDIAAGDFDGDGIDDLIYGGPDLGYLPSGAVMPVQLASSAFVDRVIAADLNDDDNLDILALSGGGGTAYFGGGDGTLIGQATLIADGSFDRNTPAFIDLDPSSPGDEFVYGRSIEAVFGLEPDGASTAVGSVEDDFGGYAAGTGDVHAIGFGGVFDPVIFPMQFMDGSLQRFDDQRTLISGLNFFDTRYSIASGQLGPHEGRTLIVSRGGQEVIAFSGLDQCAPDHVEDLETLFDLPAAGFRVFPGGDNLATSAYRSSDILLDDLNQDGFPDLIYTAADSSLAVVRFSDGLYRDGFEDNDCFLLSEILPQGI